MNPKSSSPRAWSWVACILITLCTISAGCQAASTTGSQPSLIARIGSWFQSTTSKFQAEIAAGEAWAQTDSGKAAINDFLALVKVGVSLEGGGARSQANVAAIASIARSLEAGSLNQVPTDTAVISAVSNYLPSGVNTKVVTALQQIAAAGPNPNGSLEAAANAIDGAVAPGK